MKTAKDLELSILLKESHIQQLNLKIHELEAEIERLKEDISNYVKITLHDRKEIDRLNNIRNNTIDFCNRYLSLNLDAFNADKLLKKIIEIQEGEENGKN